MRLATTASPMILERDLKTLALFVHIYCKHRHARIEKRPATVPFCDLERLLGKPIELCPDCAKLLTHAVVKRSTCPMHPKPMCKHCPSHCYHPHYREQIREVMRFSGMKMILGGRLDYLFHLLF